MGFDLNRICHETLSFLSKGTLIRLGKVHAAAATDHICYMKNHNLLKSA